MVRSAWVVREPRDLVRGVREATSQRCTARSTTIPTSSSSPYLCDGDTKTRQSRALSCAVFEEGVQVEYVMYTAGAPRPLDDSKCRLHSSVDVIEIIACSFSLSRARCLLKSASRSRWDGLEKNAIGISHCGNPVLGDPHVPHAPGRGRLPQGYGSVLQEARWPSRNLRWLQGCHGRRERCESWPIRAMVPSGVCVCVCVYLLNCT